MKEKKKELPPPDWGNLQKKLEQMPTKERILLMQALASESGFGGAHHQPISK